MFSIKVTDDNGVGSSFNVYHAYRYRVSIPNTSESQPLLSMVLTPDGDLFDNNTCNVPVFGTAYIMNENGKTIDTIRNHN